MKHYFTIFCVAVLAGFCVGFQSCSDDDGYSAVDNNVPVVTSQSNEILIEPGMKTELNCIVTDADGIKSITITNDELLLNKTIDILEIYGDTVHTYNVLYNITPADSLGIATFPVLITVCDLVGNQTQYTITISTDGDVTNPKFVSQPDSVLNTLSSNYKFKLSLSDNKALDYLTVKCDLLNYEETVNLNGATSYSYDHLFAISEQNTPYVFEYSVTDKAGLKTDSKMTITKSELQDYEKMYLCDVAEDDLITDVCGVPMLIDHTGQFEYTARYYNMTAGTEIRFLPQKTAYAPICFGLDPLNEQSLTPDPDQAKPIILDQTGVYYKIVFNTKAATYTISTYTVDEAVDPIPPSFTLGEQDLNTWCTGTWNSATGVFDDAVDPWMQAYNIGLLTSDASSDNPSEVSDFFAYNSSNKHILEIKNYSLTKGSFNFHPHNWHSQGWWDYTTWKPEKATKNDPEHWVFAGNYANPQWNAETSGYNNYVSADNMGNHAELTVNKDGKYDIIFDIHLGRMKIVPSK